MYKDISIVKKQDIQKTMDFYMPLLLKKSFIYKEYFDAIEKTAHHTDDAEYETLMEMFEKQKG